LVRPISPNEKINIAIIGCGGKGQSDARNVAHENIVALCDVDQDRAGRTMREHAGKPFYEALVEFMLSGPTLAIVAEGQRVIEGFRSLAGATDPTSAAPGTIRGDLGRDWGLKVMQNLVHGSDSPESAAREIGIWFPEL